jgi:glycosyltransferase involved in cell wall biosynthesis
MKQINPNISACIITNDDLNVIGTIESIYDSVSEIIIVNTCETTKVNEAVKKYDKVKMLYYKWEKDFSKPRNYGIEQAKGDWIMIIDSDERLEKRIEYLDDDYLCYQCKQQNGKFGILHNRIFQNHKGIFFKNRVHETIDHHLTPQNCVESDIVMLHSGYQISEEQMAEKMKRNYELIFIDYENVVRNLHLGNYYFTYKQDYEKALEYYELAAKDRLNDAHFAVIYNNIHACQFMLKYPLNKLVQSLRRSLMFEPFQLYARVNIVEHLLSCINEENKYGFLKEINSHLDKITSIINDKLGNLMHPDLEIGIDYVNEKFQELRKWGVERIAV